MVRCCWNWNQTWATQWNWSYGRSHYIGLIIYTLIFTFNRSKTWFCRFREFGRKRNFIRRKPEHPLKCSFSFYLHSYSFFLLNCLHSTSVVIFFFGLFFSWAFIHVCFLYSLTFFLYIEQILETWSYIISELY